MRFICVYGHGKETEVGPCARCVGCSLTTRRGTHCLGVIPVVVAIVLVGHGDARVHTVLTWRPPCWTDRYAHGPQPNASWVDTDMAQSEDREARFGTSWIDAEYTDASVTPKVGRAHVRTVTSSHTASRRRSVMG